jgi:hypothetical protein
MSQKVLYEVKTPRKRLYQILREARDKINNGGEHWIKGALRSRRYNGYAYCSVGAINNVEGITAQERRDALYILGLKGLELTPNEYNLVKYDKSERAWAPFLSAIMRFNDRVDTKWDDVNRAFRKAIRSVR